MDQQDSTIIILQKQTAKAAVQILSHLQYLILMTSAHLTVISQTVNSTIYSYGQGNHRMAIKTVPSHNLKLAAHLRNEYLLLKKLSHPNVIRIFKYEQNLISNVQNSSELAGALICLPRNSQTLYFQTIISKTAESVQPNVRSDICHRDIKLDNILVCQQEGRHVAKIADFGFATACRKGKKNVLFNEFKGTRQGYMAPEIFAARNNSTLQYDGKMVDIFAIGVILFTLVFRKLPFEEANPANRLYKLLIDEKYSQFWAEHGCEKKQMEIGNLEQFKQLFVGLTLFCASQRPSICQITQNQWIKGYFLRTEPRKQGQQIRLISQPVNA